MDDCFLIFQHCWVPLPLLLVFSVINQTNVLTGFCETRCSDKQLMETLFPGHPQYGPRRLICLILIGTQVSWNFSPTSILSSLYAQAHGFPYCSVLKCQKYVFPLPDGKRFLMDENCTYRKLFAVNFFRFRRQKPILYNWINFPKRLHFAYWYQSPNFHEKKNWTKRSLLKNKKPPSNYPRRDRQRTSKTYFFDNRFWANLIFFLNVAVKKVAQNLINLVAATSWQQTLAGLKNQRKIIGTKDCAFF